MTRPISVLVGSLVLAAILLAGSLPVMTWYHQHQQLTRVDSQLATANQKDAALAKEAGQLRNMQYVGNLARSQYGMVPKGSREFVILPPQKGTGK